MLTIANIKSSSKTTDYFCVDDYYLKDSDEHQNLSSWYGKGAEELGLSGNVSKEDFKRILDGKIGQDIILGNKKENGQLDHFPGIDMTFAPPKSVSIVSELLGNEKEVRLAHNNAVDKVLNIVEKDYISTRVKNNGKVTKEATDNLIIAKFLHNTNRNLEPHLHSHCIVANAVRKDNGDWRSAWFKDIFDNKLNLGSLYRSELAHNLTKLGYNIEQKSGIANFEITGVPHSLIKAFSSRREEILAKLKELGQNDAQAKQLANLLTRSKKNTVAHNELKQYWKENLAKKLDSLNIKKEILERKNLTQDNINSNLDNNLSKISVDFAIKHLSQRKTVFNKIEIEKLALNDSFGKINIDQIHKEINQRILTKELLEDKTGSYRNSLTTGPLLKIEQEILSISKEGRGKFSPILSDQKSVDSLLPVNLDFNHGQKDAIRTILTSKDQLLIVQGYAGTGKTYMLKAVNKIAYENGYELMGLSPTGVATRNLIEEANIQSSTLQKFLSASSGYEGVARGRGTPEGIKNLIEKFKNKLIIVDEGSMIGTNQMKDLLTISKTLKFKVVLIGDIKQLDSVEAGIPFYELQRNGVKTVVMNDIVRQNNQNIKSAVSNIINSKVEKAFEKLDSNIVEVTRGNRKEESIEEFNERIQKVVAGHFIALSQSKRNDTMILVSANESKDGINDIISKELFAERKEKSKNAKGFEIYQNRNLTEAEKTRAYKYNKSSVILMNKNYSSDLKRGEYYQVIKISKEDNMLTVQKIDQSLIGIIKQKFNKNHDIVFNPAKLEDKQGKLPFEVFKGNIDRIFKKGDRIAFNRSINSLGVVNSDQGQITKITKNKISINLDNKQDPVTLDKSSFNSKHIDHCYAVTSHKAQGLSVSNIIALTESWRKNLTNQKNFYVQISRAKDNLTIITDDKQETINNLKENTGIDISARQHQNIPSYLEQIIAKQDSKKKQQRLLLPYQKEEVKETIKDKSPQKTKYYIPELSEYEIKEHFIQAAQDIGIIDNIDINKGVDNAFANIGKKIWCGKKTEIEIRWFGNAGYIKNYKHPDNILKWGINSIKSDNIQYRELSLDEIKQRNKAEKLRQQKLKQQEKLKHEAGAKKANKNFNYYTQQNKDLARKHKYLVNKGIEYAVNIRGIKITTDNRIVIPIKDVNGNITSLQYINEDGKKFLLKDGVVNGNFFVIGAITARDSNIIVAEGFSTAVTIHHALNKPVVVAFSASNIENVIKNLNDKHKGKEFVIAGDNDIHKEHNTGKQVATNIASKFNNVKVFLPQFNKQSQNHKPSDFNDLAKLEGINEVKKQFNDFDKQINNKAINKSNVLEK